MGQTTALERLPVASPPVVGVVELPVGLTRIFAELERPEEEREKSRGPRPELASQPRRVPRPFAYQGLCSLFRAVNC
jgi:hypothetical protein